MISDDTFRELAVASYHRDGECEIDDDAVVSRGNEPVTGAYVAAWVWVEMEEDENK